MDKFMERSKSLIKVLFHKFSYWYRLGKKCDSIIGGEQSCPVAWQD